MYCEIIKIINMLRVCFIYNIVNYIRKFYDVIYNLNEIILIIYLVGLKILRFWDLYEIEKCFFL